ncbi:hypothetical protein [Pseudovibrio sp. Tun.PSC04-5.I4]|uniref:hypothetical protein n=1 Tax=Pseudovibrio sp. Tun.PSC04-5.I4 TaxID=1798213 RepID=UPI000886871B|nr:hypothetical protein [Pseudovibrio sp. Tun.PSC04-5.I4]SDR45211.1 Uncharacterized membrane-anchored protein YhcB, DUF1043 family [Pseudovibrio sp. Tun.PSC04-5.I4]
MLLTLNIVTLILGFAVTILLLKRSYKVATIQNELNKTKADFEGAQQELSDLGQKFSEIEKELTKAINDYDNMEERYTETFGNMQKYRQQVLSLTDEAEEEQPEEKLNEGEFSCTISILQHEGLIHEVDVDFVEIIKAISPAKLIETLADRYSLEASWSVNARDWTGAEHSHKHKLTPESIDAQHEAIEAQQIKRSEFQGVGEIAF